MTTATIETLTAEVRTLMLGSRQVTLSVAKQLDTVPLSTLQVFGRVKLGTNPNGNNNLVIGSSREGTLALAYYETQTEPEISFLDETMIDGKIHVCSAHPSHGRLLRLTYRGAGDFEPPEKFEIPEDSVVRCGIPGHRAYGETCNGWWPGGLEHQIRRELRLQRKDHEEWAALHKAAAESPLIILAGLK